MTTPASSKAPPVRYSSLDPQRFDHLEESEILQRIGAILAVGVMRHQHAQRQRQVASTAGGLTSAADLLMDPLEREIIRHLSRVGQTTLIDMQFALDASRGVLMNRLQRLRSAGLCLRIGRTRGARYRLRGDFSGN
jgi:hypothetical protein